MRQGIRPFITLTISVGVIGLSIWGVLHRQDIWDWIRLQTYTPPSEIAALAERTTMANRGRDLFYASQPEIHGRDSFNTYCQNDSEQSIVLGCYTRQQIYLFDVVDPQLAGVKEVTAAHEMLHAVYERLGADERRTLDNLLKQQLSSITDARIKELATLYNKEEPGQLYNEMHSILATEYSALSPELEAHYKKYFGDRHKVVAFSRSYESVFSASKTRIEQLDAQLAGLKQQIDTNNSQLEASQQQLQAESNRLDSLRTSNPSAYNAAVPGYNSQVRDYNALVNKTKQLVAQYNQLVDERNQQAAAQNNLYHSLNSKYQPVQQN